MSDESLILELLPAYALGVLDEDETTFVSEHLVDCSSCQAELSSFRMVVDELALTVPDITPPVDLKRRILKYAQPPPVVMAPPKGFWQRLSEAFIPHTGAMAVVSAAALLLIVILTISNLILWQRSNQSIAIAKPGEMLSLPISSTGVIPDAAGFIVISADRLSGVVVVDQLSPLEEEQQYQLWLIRDGQRTSGAIFPVDETGYGWKRVIAPQPLTEYREVAITVEPAEGSPQPTGEDLLRGPLFSP